ncbi:MAG: carbon storage regulator [Planctomycetota bacterium]
MLVLQRKPGEEIVIGDQISVKLVKAGPNRVTLAIEAPPEVTIRRAELEAKAAVEPEVETARPKSARSMNDTICL